MNFAESVILQYMSRCRDNLTCPMSIGTYLTFVKCCLTLLIWAKMKKKNSVLSMQVPTYLYEVKIVEKRSI